MILASEPCLFAKSAFFRTHFFAGSHTRIYPLTLLEDREGFIWIGTEEGLFKYDGYDPRPIQMPDSMQDQAITALCQAPDGVIWVGHRSGEISYLLDQHLELVDWEEGHPQAKITALMFDQKASLWMATYGEGLYVKKDHRLYNFNTDDGLLNDEIYSMELDSQDRVWVSTDQGINICEMSIDEKERKKKKIEIFSPAQSLPDQIIPEIYLDDQGILWMGTFDSGIVSYDVSKQETRYSDADWGYGEIKEILRLGSELWVGTRRHGIVVLNAETLESKKQYCRHTGYENDHILALLQDREGNIWVAGDQTGLQSVFPYLEWLPLPSRLSQTNISCVWLDRKEEIWVAHARNFTLLPQGMDHTRVGEAVSYTLPGEEDAGIISMGEGPLGAMWMGTFGDGLYRVDADSKSIKKLAIGQGMSIFSLLWKADTLWLSTLSGVFWGIMNREKGDISHLHPFPEQEALESNYIYQIFADSKGRIWFATDGAGVSVYEDGKLQMFGPKDGLTAAVVYSIGEDHQGQIWTNSPDSGLFRFDGEGFHKLEGEMGLSSLSPSALVADREGNLILVNDDGIDLLHTEKHSIMYFREEQGWDNLNPDLNAVHHDTHGNIWIATQRGVIHYQPIPARFRSQPETRLQYLSVLLKEPVDTSLHSFAYAQNHLSFDFIGLWFQDPEKVSYSYMLEGLDLDWQHTLNRKVTYPQLPAGAYTFRLRSALNQQYAGSPELSYSFRIRAPFWQTYWFYLICVAAACGLAYAFTYVREQRLHREAQFQQEAIRFQFETLRNQVNPHFLFNSFNTLISIIEDSPETAVQYVNKLSDFFRNILSYRDTSLIPLTEELSLLESYVFLLKERYGESLTLKVEIPDLYLDYLLPPMTLQMLIENAIKHNVISQRKPLTIDLCVEDGQYLLVHNPVRKKRSPAPSTGLGLENIRKRYLLLGADDIQIDASDTDFLVKVPLIGTAHERE